MGSKLYVGNLPYSATEDSLKSHFAKAGSVTSVKIITDRDTGRSKGFGFVEMDSDSSAEKAISQLDGQEFDGRAIRVTEAKPQEPRENRGPRGGGHVGHGGGRGSRDNY
jgi:RNA recognition motif-containing protein